MGDGIRIQMMRAFAIYAGEAQADQLLNKSRKGAALVQYLILNRGERVPNARLLATLWSEERTANPESALKTLVSRVRALLNQICPGLGRAIVADRGAYHWAVLPGMSVDLYQIEDLLDVIAAPDTGGAERARRCAELMELYTGDLLQDSEQGEWVLARAAALHSRYMAAVYAYVDWLKAREDHAEIVNVCRAALEIDHFDDRLHMELMTALVNTNRSGEALAQYRHVMHLHYRYLGVQPSEDMQAFYKQIVRAGKTLELNLESIRSELREGGDQRGAFVCEYAVFKEIFNLQMRNLERLGSTMFLAVIMVCGLDGEPLDNIRQDNAMAALLDILRNNLRKGDTIARFSPTIFALLLPTVNYTTGNMVMERVKRLFYRRHPSASVAFHYRVGPLSSEHPPEKGAPPQESAPHGE